MERGGSRRRPQRDRQRRERSEVQVRTWEEVQRRATAGEERMVRQQNCGEKRETRG